MLAAYYDRFGSASNVIMVGTVETPRPADGEVLIRLHSSGINPYDVKYRSGLYDREMPFPRIIPHCDGAGIIEATGPGVDTDRIGERIWLRSAQAGRAFGTAAQYICIPSQLASHLPDEMSFEEGACLGIPYLTAYQAVMRDGPVNGQTIVVSGGGGAVGFYAVQLAKAHGAVVIGTASSPESASRSRTAGADHIIDYKKEDVAERVRELTNGIGADRLVEVEFGLNLPKFTKIVRRSGIVAAYGSAAELMPEFDFRAINAHGLTLHFGSVQIIDPVLCERAIETLLVLSKERKLRHVLGRIFGLEDIVKAHELVETATKKAQLRID